MRVSLSAFSEWLEGKAPQILFVLGRDEVAAELGRTLDFCKVPRREKGEVLAAFAAHKNEVTAGYMSK